MTNEQFLQRIKEKRNIVQTIKRRKSYWICHILRRNCLLKRVIEGSKEGEIEVTRRRKQLLDYLKEKTGYWTMEEAKLDHIHWRTLFGRGYETVERQTTECVKCINELLFLATQTMFFVIHNINQYVRTYVCMYFFIIYRACSTTVGSTTCHVTVYLHVFLCY